MQHHTQTTAATFAAVLGVLRVSGHVADMWVQTDYQARRKGAYDDAPLVEKDEHGHVTGTYGSREGRLACAQHVLSYVGTQGAALFTANRFLGLGLRPSRIAAALLLSGTTHYVIDRRRPLKNFAHATGKGHFHDRLAPICGSFELDQAAHHLFEGIAAGVAAR